MLQFGLLFKGLIVLVIGGVTIGLVAVFSQDFLVMLMGLICICLWAGSTMIMSFIGIPMKYSLIIPGVISVGAFYFFVILRILGSQPFGL